RSCRPSAACIRDTAATSTPTLSQHYALPICKLHVRAEEGCDGFVKLFRQSLPVFLIHHLRQAVHHMADQGLGLFLAQRGSPFLDALDEIHTSPSTHETL